MRIARFSFLALALLAATGGRMSAQGLGIGASVGANVPNGKFGDNAKTGLLANAIAELRLPIPLAFRGELFWSRSDLDNAFIRKVGNTVLPVTSPSDVTGNVNMIGAIGNVVLNLGSGVIHPYLIGGVGVYHSRVAQDIAGTATEFRHLTNSNNQVGYNGGAGLTLSLIGVHVFVEARDHSVNTTPDRTNFIPVAVGLTF